MSQSTMPDNRPVTGYPLSSTANGCTPPSAGTGTAASTYPYINNANQYPYGSYAPPHMAQRASRIRHLTVVLLCAMAIMSVILFTFWLVLRPRLPEFTLRSFSQSGFNISGQRLSATWNASFGVANPNKKMTIEYNQVIANVFHKDYYLAEARVPPFQQGTRDERTVDVDLVVVSSYVDQPVLNAINGEQAGGEMKFNVKLFADFAFHYGRFRGRRRFLKVWCNNVRISSSSGTMAGGPKDCRVGY